ncbi:MAG TPA: L-seryl-tRNA(Sec) selenium transferase [Candidatus Aminicenantes bacterium]|nr:L-seryl-tRNA(Sec) selenium transferase [Candidatus Aminicenantes bacterium]HRY65602.1 L-seryl-tRNA(Sec) selenium transferase [Candidatus Aminicenantes bacterium]HRZ72510.1 L-seryl-tRNA(Sec) selenium transferase [Candidatus Aminicenantes bacterium]
MTETIKNAACRRIPSLDALLGDPAAAPLLDRYGREAVAAAARGELEEIRRAIAAGPAPASGTAPDLSPAALAPRVRARLERRLAPSLAPAVNATGVIMHSGLGRAVLSAAAGQALDDAASGYSTLALDRDSGKRVSRDRHVEGLLRELTGAEAATVANNNAAATVLILNTLARGKEVIVSRGQLVEIGGSFRLPDVMAMSGASLREIGTTNKTHLSDYEAAIGESTGAILRVHHSNYRIVGFAEEPPIADLAALGRARGIPVVDDLGSGALVDLARYGLAAEPLVRDSVTAGADVVCFSGDKLIGGPQSGLIAGGSAWIARIRKNPLARAFRCGKLTLAALEATLRLFLAPDRLEDVHPIYRMLALTPDELGRRAGNLAASLRKNLPASAAVAVEDGASEVGSGAVPVETLPTKVLSVRSSAVGAEELARRLRLSTPPVFARIHKGAVLLDLRTVQPGEDTVVERAVREALT